MAIPASRLTARNAYRLSDERAGFAQAHSLPIDTRLWSTTLVGGGTVTHDPAMSSSIVQASTASGDRAVLQSVARPRPAYNRARATMIMGHCDSAGITNQKKRWGIFDDSNGYFFELDGETLYAVRRTNVSGSVVETRVARAQWSLEKDPIDVTRTHVWEIRESWPNSDVTFFVDDEAVHVISTDGFITGPGTRYPRLPVAVECVNTAAAASAGSFACISASVYLEEKPRHDRTFGTHRSDSSVGTSPGEALLSIRPKLTFSSIANLGELQPDELSITASGDCRVQLVAGGTVGDGSWASHDASSLAESNTTCATYPTGSPVVVAEFVCTGTLSVFLGEFLDAVRLNGSTQDSLTVCAFSLTGSSITVRAALTWKETR